MRTIITTAITAAVAGAVWTVVAPTTPTQAHASAATRHTTVTLRLHPRGGGQVDLGDPGMSLGDEFFEHGTITGAARGHYLLDGALIAMPHGSTPPRESQHFTLRLGHGSIEAVGQHPAVNRFTVAVVGGTGAWNGATGTLRVAHGEVRIDVVR
jgi:hypothetical protein